mmetsp:Transcript_13706/g.34982  ORF Transcript_13706/g.34982 Transcript_13706/m.34982 type:complete len:207 (+) Transcript_13706:221-841(+)
MVVRMRSRNRECVSSCTRLRITGASSGSDKKDTPWCRWSASAMTNVAAAGMRRPAPSSPFPSGIGDIDRRFLCRRMLRPGESKLEVWCANMVSPLGMVPGSDWMACGGGWLWAPGSDDICSDRVGGLGGSAVSAFPRGEMRPNEMVLPLFANSSLGTLGSLVRCFRLEIISVSWLMRVRCRMERKSGASMAALSALINFTRSNSLK